MRIAVWAGTPNHVEREVKDTPSTAKSWVLGRLANRKKWTAAHNLKMDGELMTIREQIDSLNLQSLPIGKQREWSTTDDYTGVTFVFGLEVQAK